MFQGKPSAVYELMMLQRGVVLVLVSLDFEAERKTGARAMSSMMHRVDCDVIACLCKLRKQKRCDLRCRCGNDVLAGMPGQVEEGVLTGKQEGLTCVHIRRRLRGLLHFSRSFLVN